MLSDVIGLYFSCSLDGKFIVSVGSGPGRVWDISSSMAKASLPKENVSIDLYFLRMYSLRPKINATMKKHRVKNCVIAFSN